MLLCCIMRILQVGGQSQLRSPLVLFCCTIIIITVIIIIITIAIIIDVLIMVITIRNHVGSDLYRPFGLSQWPFRFASYHVGVLVDDSDSGGGTVVESDPDHLMSHPILELAFPLHRIV